MSAVRLTAVQKCFFEGDRVREVLSKVSFSVEKGELVALLGRSGSGKSTLLHLIAGIDSPTSGTVEVGGANLGQLSESARTLVRRHRIGFVFQFFNLLPTLTVGENVRLPLELVGKTADAASLNSAQRLLDAVGLGDRGSSFPDRLSGGEQQRAAIARALVHDPGLILADEPTGALDDETGASILDLFTSLAKSSGKAVILVSHSAEVARRADRVLRLEAGHVHEISPSAA